MNAIRQPSKEKSRQLFEVADSQRGYFTARQAIETGFSSRMQTYHVQNGDWEREWRGVYRLANYPGEFDDYMLWYLWSADQTGAPQGVYSHDTALRLHGLSTWSGSSKKHMTVPFGFRRQVVPKGISLHYANLRPEDITVKTKFKLTQPLRTIVDLLVAGNVEEHHIWEALQEGISRRIILPKQIEDARLTDTERKLLLNSLAKATIFKSPA